MLRNALILFGVFLSVGGLIAWAGSGLPGGIGALICGALLLLGIIFERVFYKRNTKKVPGPGWVKTTERFVDDETGKTVTVYVQPETGERIYVEE